VVFTEMSKNMWVSKMSNELIIANKSSFTETLETVPLNEIPQFRIIGSKYNLLQEIYNTLKKEQITGYSFFDVFSGSAIVGRFFKRMFSVISNDNLYFSYVLQRALIVINKYPSFSNLNLKNLSADPKIRIYQVLEYLNNAKGVEGFVYKHYTPASKDIDGVERKYFSIENGKKIDAIRIKIEEWFKNNYISDDEYFYLIASLLFAVQKVANISGTYGAFNKFWDPRSYKTITLKYIEIIPSKFDHKAYNEDIFNLLKEISCDVAYIDPPYNSRQYIDNYHLLETIAKYDNPEIKGKTGLREGRDNKKSVFCDKENVKNAFLKLLTELKTKYVLISYNSDGLLSKNQIIQILKESEFERVKCYEIPYRRFKSNNNSKKSELSEYLFVGVKMKKNDKV
jgi:adenine-specific DNA-methyltransferase